MIALVYVNSRTDSHPGWRGGQQLSHQRQPEADRDHTSNFSQHIARRWDLVALLLLRLVGQPGIRAKLNFFHGSTPALAEDARDIDQMHIKSISVRSSLY